MSVLVDTSVWSLALRRRGSKLNEAAMQLEGLIRDGRVRMIGPIRQEILSGIKEAPHFARLSAELRHFPDLTLDEQDYEQAARFYNQCRTHGVQGSNTDFLICAAASRRKLSIFTNDKDFTQFARWIPITFHKG